MQIIKLLKIKLMRPNKGQKARAQAFVDALQSGDSSHLIPLEQLFEVAEICIQLDRQLRA